MRRNVGFFPCANLCVDGCDLQLTLRPLRGDLVQAELLPVSLKLIK